MLASDAAESKQQRPDPQLASRTKRFEGLTRLVGKLAQPRQLAGHLGHHLRGHRDTREHLVVVEGLWKGPVDGPKDIG